MSDHPDDAVHGRAFDRRLMARLVAYARPHRGLALLSVAVTVLASLLQSAPPVLLGLAVDRGIVRRDLDALTAVGAAYVLLEAVRFGAVYAQGLLVALLGQRVVLDLRQDLARKIVHQSMTFFAREPVGKLVTRIVNDVGSIGDLFSAGAVAVFQDALLIILSAALLLWLDWRLAIVTLLAAPLLALVVGGVTARIRATFRDLRRLLARNIAYLAESVAGARVIQLFSREEVSARRFRSMNDEHLEVQLRSQHWHAVYISLITLVTSGAVAAILWRGGGAALEGALEVGVLVAFVGAAQNLFQPIRDIAEKVATFQAAMASAERVFGLIDEEVLFATPASPAPLPDPLRGELHFDRVSFAYPTREEAPPQVQGRTLALREVSFRLRPGERVAIVGHTGAGKSTIVSLLARLYDPTEGRVLVDGVDLRSIDERALRREIGVVLQDVFIFAGTILDNIRLGDARVSEEDARRAARAVGADRFVERLPRGYQEEMRERGATLSLGEKQLLSFARALAFDPKVLILDEATSSVDPATEAALRGAIREAMRGRTSILIAHRLATVEDVDRVLVFHRGELREDGSPRELLERGGLFARLYRLQQGGAEGLTRARTPTDAPA